MFSLLQLVNEQFTKWVEEENRQLRIIEESAASLVAAAKTHPARKPHLKRLREAQKSLEIASEQCILYTKLADNLNKNQLATAQSKLIDELRAYFANTTSPVALNELIVLES